MFIYMFFLAWISWTLVHKPMTQAYFIYIFHFNFIKSKDIIFFYDMGIFNLAVPVGIVPIGHIKRKQT